MKIGTITANASVDGFNQRHTAYFLDGDFFSFNPYQLQDFYINPRRISVGDRVTIGNTPLVCISKDSKYPDEFLFGRANKLTTFVYAIGTPITEKIKLIYRRIILTLCVWNLGIIENGGVPSYRWIVRRWKKK